MRISVLIIIILFSSIKVSACSAFMCRAKNSVYFAKNFDWQHSHSYIIKNDKNIFKNGYNFKGDNTVSWTSKYGSLTFNQIGKEFPFGGMNEAGLVVKQLWNQDDCEYEVFEHSKTISELEWIQYQLDNYASVDEVLYALKQLTIIPVMAKVHYFIADTSGKSAIIEFINGKTVVIESSDNHQLITNSNYKNSQNYWATHKNNLDKTSGSSLDRYCHLTKSISELNLDDSVDPKALFKTLLPTRTTQTQWSIVYDITAKEIQFLSRNNPNVKTVKLHDFNFENNNSIAAKINSESLNFEAYTFEKNKSLVDTFHENFGIPYIDYEKMNAYQMQPEKALKDDAFENTINIKVNFKVKKTVEKSH
ncbi:linear amide C-N hydrolase [Hyunsoonleella flava]|uniref:Linear amide C-N hydrolase n=1 Tax=Hyunsoonleella flava TaxID=2527939 RepID=A0A4Q9FCU2_9FLAO|nr:linear amide C-N hydrolase [Hyunsoonleella flava]TBM99392.1 linear amide C-N hydrolase [Hyunsoonleella flava]